MKYFCVISHTHWDREWYQPLEEFRLRLVDLIDRCLLILKENPDYIFHLDAQTIVLEDYLEIRPSKRELLKNYISAGQLIVGPWYLQNDFYLTSGEATVRNLLSGVAIANEFGACSKVGYAADQFGNISQLPQILNGFGIDNFVFGRGFSEYYEDENGKAQLKANPSEFIWEGADNSRLLAIHMKYWYNNAQRFSADLDKAEILVNLTEKMFDGIAVTPYILLMNGVDHLEAQDDLLPILKSLNKRLGKNRSIAQYNLFDYVERVKEYTKNCEDKLLLHKGELRMGHDKDLLKGTLSSRTYLKRENVRAQTMLECKLEPIYSMLELAGAKGAYSLDHFHYMWKALMKNHPHDSICGCSRDEVHKHMEDNYERLACTTHDMLRRGLVTLGEHLKLQNSGNEKYYILAVNTTELAQSGVLTVEAEFPCKENVKGFCIYDDYKRPVEFEVLAKEKASKDIFSPLNLPGVMEVDRFTIRLFADNLKPFSATGFLVEENNSVLITPGDKPLQRSHIVIENENIRLTFSKCGRVDYINKKTGQSIIGLTELEDTADCGDSYVYMPSHELAILGSEFESELQILSDTPMCKSVKVTTKLQVPKSYSFDNRLRSLDKVECLVAVTYTLYKNDEFVRLSYEINNLAKDHRIRFLVRTNIDTHLSCADIPFDIVTHHSADHCYLTKSKVRPNTSFALLESENTGVAVFTQGQHEYEHIVNEQTLAFTLLRATGLISREFDLSPTAGENWECPENQCLRTIKGEMAVFGYKNNYLSANVPVKAKQFRVGVLNAFLPCNSKKFMGGRTAVQDTRLEEFFYLPDMYPSVKVPNGESFFTLDNENIFVLAVKKSEDENGTILRLLNLCEYDCSAKLLINHECFSCNMDESNCCYLGCNEISLSFRKKEIKTLLIKN